MKKLLLMLVLFGAAYLFSCNKNDFPDPKKVCQIKLIDREPGPTASGTIEYQYNEKRLLTKLIRSFGFDHRDFTFEYNNQGRLLVMGDLAGNGYYNLIYQNGLVTQIDQYINSNFVGQGFFLYDHKRRLIEKRGLIPSALPIVMARYEYEGHSRNPKRELFFMPPIQPGQTVYGANSLTEIDPNPVVIREFKYDNKINPEATLLNQLLNPWFFGHDNVLGFDFFEPIPDNNVVYMKLTRRIEGVYYNFVENHITYDYNGHYPTFQTMRAVQHYPDGRPDTELIAHTKFSYDCTKK